MCNYDSIWKLFKVVFETYAQTTLPLKFVDWKIFTADVSHLKVENPTVKDFFHVFDPSNEGPSCWANFGVVRMPKHIFQIAVL